MRVLRRSQPEPVDETDETRRWEQLLASHRTWAPRSVVRARYHAAAAAKRQRPAGTNAPPNKGTSQSRSSETPSERFEGFEILAGNADRINERIEEVRSWEPEDELREYSWNGFGA